MKLLLVDSSFLHNSVIKQDTLKFFNKNGIQCEYFEATYANDALQTIIDNNIDIAYIDISSKDYDGIQLLKDIKALDCVRQPKIVAVTILDDKKYRYEALKLDVYRYIYKPYDYLEIETSLEKLFNDNYYSKESNRVNNTINTDDIIDDEFMDFDDSDSDSDDEFMDFDGEHDDIDHNKELMDIYNDSHKKLSAKEFLAEYEEQGIDLEELDGLEEDLDSLIAKLLFDYDVKSNLENITNLLEEYNRFLYTFSEFEELSKVIYILVELLNDIDFDTLKSTKMCSKFIVAIIEDLVDWKEHVFVLEDAVDVYYINASILNSYVQLKDIVTK